jgi:hypothetical protein
MFYLPKNKNDAIALFLTPREFNPSVDASIESSIKAFNAIVPLSIQPQFHFAHIYWEDLLKELQNEPTFQLVESKYFFPMFFWLFNTEKIINQKQAFFIHHREKSKLNIREKSDLFSRVQINEDLCCFNHQPSKIKTDAARRVRFGHPYEST